MEYNSTSKIKLIFESKHNSSISEVTKLINIEPSYSHKLGESVEYVKSAKSSIWELEYPETDAYSGLDEMIISLLNSIKDKRDEINYLKESGYDAMISIVISKTIGDDVGLDLEHSTIKRLSILGLSLHYTVYDEEIDF